MTKDAIKDTFLLDQVCRLLRVMGTTSDIEAFMLKDIAVGDNKFDIIKSGNTLVVKVKDSNESIEINYDIKENKEEAVYFLSYPSDNCELNINYNFGDGTRVNLNGKVITGLASDPFKNIGAYDLMNNTDITYIANGKAQKFNWNNLEPGNVTINSLGPVLNGIQLSGDNNEILSINGVRIPSRKAMETFDIEKEKDKIKYLLEDPRHDISEVTKLAIEGHTVPYLEEKSEYFKKMAKDYDYITGRITSLMDVRANMIERFNDMNTNLTDLELISDIVEEETKVVQSEKKKDTKHEAVLAKRLGSR